MFDIFSLKDFKFPHGFVWGSSTAGHQIEGDNVHSGRWVEEKEAHAVNPEYELSGKACDHYNRVDEDIELLVKLGHRAYRMSVEWARIQPEEGVFDKEATEHYIRELARLKERGITTFVTLVHVSMPYWFEQKGGFFDLKNFRYFETYLRYILPKISPYVDFWNIFNEFNLGISEFYLNKKFNHTICHAHAYHIMKEYTSAPISSAHAFVRYYGLRQSDPFDRAAQAWYDAIDNEFFFHAKHGRVGGAGQRRYLRQGYKRHLRLLVGEHLCAPVAQYALRRCEKRTLSVYEHEHDTPPFLFGRIRSRKPVRQPFAVKRQTDLYHRKRVQL